MNKTSLLLVGGTFDDAGGRPSGYVNKLAAALSSSEHFNVVLENGGPYARLSTINGSYGVVVWMPNIPNDKPKILNDIKSKDPTCILVSSKRNDNNKYPF
jgi:hypothetical protein